MSRYVTRKSIASERLTPRLDDGTDLLFLDRVVFDLSVYDVEPVATGILDDEGNEILRVDTNEYMGFFPLNDVS